MAKVICGVNQLESDSFNGQTINQIVRNSEEMLNIPPDALILINGEEIGDRDYVVHSSDEVEFVKTAGDKGSV